MGQDAPPRRVAQQQSTGLWTRRGQGRHLPRRPGHRGPLGVGFVSGYAVGQLAQAFVTALTHADPATRDRAADRGRGWADVLEGIASGRLRIGERTPIAGLPAWVTPEVLRGGFVTGAAAADGPLTDAERALARRAGVPEDRRAVTEHLLTADGIAELSALLDSGAYRVPLPEHAALLVVAWLVRGEHLDAALDVVAQVRPFGDRLQLAPVPAAGPPPDPGVVHRATTDEVRAALLARRPRPAVARERRTLAVWNPLSDAFVALWSDAPGPTEDAPGWTDRARVLLERHRAATAEGSPPRRHGAPGATLEVLRAAAARAVAGAPAPGDRARVAATLPRGAARRGRRGAPGPGAGRDQPAAGAARPPHAEVAAVVAGRLGVEPGDAGLDPARAAQVVAPVAAGESAGVPGGTVVPPSVRRAVHRSRCPSSTSSAAAWLRLRRCWPRWCPTSWPRPRPVRTPTRRCSASSPARSLRSRGGGRCCSPT